ncbi:MAG: FAD-binding monooxygenase [Actinobacteria bacterium]|nr:FAD-binding monooxygenase [Actinomycetota bacterium]
MNRTIGEHALVLGGSLAGLLAARVLAERYERVTVVERDATPRLGQHRRGVPQGRHTHGLLTRGQEVMEELFPGLTQDMVDGGAPIGDLLGQVRWIFNGHRVRQIVTGLTALCVNRPVLEGRIRARVEALPNVALLPCCDAVGLTSDPAGRVLGARLLHRDDDSTAEEVASDLVVDATGRGSRMPAWLEALGYPPPEEERVRVRLGYATRLYRLRAGALNGDWAVINAASVDNPRAGVLVMVSADQAMVSLIGRLGDDPPTDASGFLAFAQSLALPDIYNAIIDADPLDEEPASFRFPLSVRRRYERLRRFPDRLLVTGDAVCSFNPVYGQGMTVAALDALALRSELERGGVPLPRRFFADVARRVDVPWTIGVGGDLAFPGVEGRRTLKNRLMNRYIAHLHAASATDARVAAAFMRVVALVDRPPQLLHPRVSVRALLYQRVPHPPS